MTSTSPNVKSTEHYCYAGNDVGTHFPNLEEIDVKSWMFLCIWDGMRASAYDSPSLAVVCL